MDALYEQLSAGCFRASRLTQGTWAKDRQHGGPVAALLTHVVESSGPPEWRISQLTVDFLGAVPMDEITVEVEEPHRTRRTRYAVAVLSCGGRQYARARAWQRAPGTSPGGVSPLPGPPPPVPAESSYDRARFAFGYQEAVEMRFVRGSFRALGPATVWARLRVPMIAGTDLADVSPLQRLAAVGDFSSGVSAEVPRESYSWSNLDLSVHVLREPRGEWLCLDSMSLIGHDGAGLCRTMVSDETGACAQISQSLFVTPLTGSAG